MRVIYFSVLFCIYHKKADITFLGREKTLFFRNRRFQIQKCEI